jgi:tetratricopeptide (TPR) repeat protein
MAEQHDNPQHPGNGADKAKPAGKPFDLNLEIPEKKRGGGQPEEVVDEILEVVDEPIEAAEVVDVPVVEEVVEVHDVAEVPDETAKSKAAPAEPVVEVHDVAEVAEAVEGPPAKSRVVVEKVEEVLEVVEEQHGAQAPAAAETASVVDEPVVVGESPSDVVLRELVESSADSGTTQPQLVEEASSPATKPDTATHPVEHGTAPKASVPTMLATEPHRDEPATPPPAGEEAEEVFDVVEEVIDVVEEVEEEAPAAKAPPQGAAEEPLDIVDEVIDVVEEVEEEAPPPKPAPPPSKAAKTRVSSRGAVPTMLARGEPEELPREELAAPPPRSSKLSKPAAKKPSKLGPPSDEGINIGEEILDATEASESGRRPPSSGLKRKSQVRKPTPQPEPDEEDILDAADALEGAPSSAGSGAPLVEAPKSGKKKPSKAHEVDRTEAFSEGEEESGKRAAKAAAGDEMDVVVEYEDEALVEGASEIDLGRRPTSKTDRPSGVDIIAEALESGVDIDSAKSRTPPQRKQRHDPESDVDLHDVLEDSAESSAVDLGSSGERPALPSSSARRRAEEEELVSADDALEMVDESALLDSGEGPLVDEAEAATVTPQRKQRPPRAEDEEIDLGAGSPPAPRGRKSTARPPVEEEEELVVPRSGDVSEAEDEEVVVPRGRHAAAAGEEETVPESGAHRQAAAAVEEEELATPRGRGRRTFEDEEKPRRGGRFLPFLTGAVLVTLLLAGAAVGVWFYDKSLLLEPLNLAEKKAGAQGTGPAPQPKVKIPDELQPLFDEYEKLVPKDGKAPGLEDEKVKQLVQKSKDVGGDKLADAFKALIQDQKNLAELKEQQDKSKQELAEAAKESEKLKGDLATLGKEKLKLENSLTTEKTNNKKLQDNLAKAIEERDGGRKLNTDINAALKNAGAKDTDVKGVEWLAAARDTLANAVANAVKELKDGNYLVDDPDVSKKLIGSIKKARLAAQSPLASSVTNVVGSLGNMSKLPGDWAKKAFDTAKLQQELKLAQVREAFAERPEKRLDTIIALLQDRGHKDAAALDAYDRFSKWVLEPEAKSSPEAKAKAHYVEALILRNKDEHDAARKALEKTLAAAADLKGDAALKNTVQGSLKELTDPAAYYLPRAQLKAATGDFKGAVQELTGALKVLPGEQPGLHLKRAEWTFEAATPAGKFDAATQKNIRDDALVAAKDMTLAPRSYYLLGKLDETNKDWAAAEKNYRQAIDTSGMSPEAEVYKVALARVLLRERPAGAEGGAPEVDKGGIEESEQPLDAPAPGVMFVSFEDSPAEQQPDEDDPAAQKRLKESMTIANQLIKSDNAKTRGEGYMLLGIAQARLGKKNEGLLNYVKGLELSYPGADTQELAKMVNTHPAFQQSDLALQVNPVLSERHFAKGLELFWGKNYAAAEAEFKKAVTFYNEDARYYYFLGMSQYLQKSKIKQAEAEYSIELGVKMEIARRPTSQVINASLERIQGELRQMLNARREKVATAG